MFNFIFKDKKVEIIQIGKEVYFNPYHVGECLGLNSDSVRKATARMISISDGTKSHIRKSKQVVKLTNKDLKDSNQTFRKLNNAGENFLTKSGVYKFIFRSQKKEAEEFQDWVTDVVLPSIEENGFYINNTEWLKTRNEGKQQRRIETDAIKEFVRYAKQQGSTKPEYYYKHFTTLVYDRLDIPKGLERDKMEQQQLLDIQALERVISMKLNKTLESSREMNYKEVYQTIKTLINDI